MIEIVLQVLLCMYVCICQAFRFNLKISKIVTGQARSWNEYNGVN